MKEEYAAVATALNQRIQALNAHIAHMSGSLEVRMNSNRIMPSAEHKLTHICLLITGAKGACATDIRGSQ